MRKILLTGGSGFLGQNLIGKFDKDQFEVLAPSSKVLNLLDNANTMSFIKEAKPDIILHAAAHCGGIGLNKKQPADLTHNNLKMLSNIFDAIREYKIQYFYGLGSVCSYGKFCPTPFKESDIWVGAPEETNSGYGEAKRLMIKEFQTHYEQYGLKGAILVMANLFGPRDHFDLENSHVIPALINKFVTADENSSDCVEVWGTGTGAGRDFLFIEDACDAIVKAVSMYLDYYDPINIGTGQETLIKDVVDCIKEFIGYEGNVVYNGKLDGQPRRVLDVSRAKEVLGFEAKTNLRNGLLKTIGWYTSMKLDEQRAIQRRKEIISGQTVVNTEYDKEKQVGVDCTIPIVPAGQESNKIYTDVELRQITPGRQKFILGLVADKAEILESGKVSKVITQKLRDRNVIFESVCVFFKLIEKDSEKIICAKRLDDEVVFTQNHLSDNFIIIHPFDFSAGSEYDKKNPEKYYLYFTVEYYHPNKRESVSMENRKRYVEMYKQISGSTCNFGAKDKKSVICCDEKCSCEKVTNIIEEPIIEEPIGSTRGISWGKDAFRIDVYDDDPPVNIKTISTITRKLNRRYILSDSIQVYFKFIGNVLSDKQIQLKDIKVQQDEDFNTTVDILPFDFSELAKECEVGPHHTLFFIIKYKYNHVKHWESYRKDYNREKYENPKLIKLNQPTINEAKEETMTQEPETKEETKTVIPNTDCLEKLQKKYDLSEEDMCDLKQHVIMGVPFVKRDVSPDNKNGVANDICRNILMIARKCKFGELDLLKLKEKYNIDDKQMDNLKGMHKICIGYAKMDARAKKIYEDFDAVIGDGVSRDILRNMLACAEKLKGGKLDENDLLELQKKYEINDEHMRILRQMHKLWLGDTSQPAVQKKEDSVDVSETNELSQKVDLKEIALPWPPCFQKLKSQYRPEGQYNPDIQDMNDLIKYISFSDDMKNITIAGMVLIAERCKYYELSENDLLELKGLYNIDEEHFKNIKELHKICNIRAISKSCRAKRDFLKKWNEESEFRKKIYEEDVKDYRGYSDYRYEKEVCKDDCVSEQVPDTNVYPEVKNPNALSDDDLNELQEILTKQEQAENNVVRQGGTNAKVITLEKDGIFDQIKTAQDLWAKFDGLYINARMNLLQYTTELKTLESVYLASMDPDSGSEQGPTIVNDMKFIMKHLLEAERECLVLDKIKQAAYVGYKSQELVFPSLDEIKELADKQYFAMTGENLSKLLGGCWSGLMKETTDRIDAWHEKYHTYSASTPNFHRTSLDRKSEKRENISSFRQCIKPNAYPCVDPYKDNKTYQEIAEKAKHKTDMISGKVVSPIKLPFVRSKKFQGPKE